MTFDFASRSGSPPTKSFSQRCNDLLDHALAQVPAYWTWKPLDRGLSVSVDERFRALPALTKREMNLLGPAAFVSPGRSLEEALRAGQVDLVATSGTTEDKIVNVWDQAWWDASERASWQLNAHAARLATGTHREAILSNPLNVGVVATKELPFEQRRLARFLYLNELADPLAWTDRHCERMLRELDEYRPDVLEANPSLLSRLCRYALRAGRRAYRPGLIALTYEMPSAIHRRHLEQVFGAPVMSSYGTTEAGYVFIECEHGRLHQNVEKCRVDFLPFRDGCGGPAVGKLLVTTFDNPWRTLVRFDVGDLGRLANGPCPCGRSEGLTLSAIEGRTVNLTLTPEGVPVTQAVVDRRLAAIRAIDEYQLRQSDPRTYELKVCCDRGFDADVARQARQALAEIYGPGARTAVEEARDLPPEASGKYRLVKPLFPVDANAFVAAEALPPPFPLPAPQEC
ncbi:MAG: hypothetical protein QM765_53435 [Myxococcales bacterium]